MILALHRLNIILTILMSIIYSNDYIWPNDYNGEITTTFCEPRFRRFHAGIDIRTKGEIGSNIYAIESGYVYRIKIEPDNYGKAVYLKLKDENIVLYSHLINFNDEIQNLIDQLYIEYNSSFFDHILNKEQIIEVDKGEIIGYAGDTGSVGGPHIHFEIRTKNNEPINPLINYYKISDNIPPIAKRISFIPINENSWINDVQDYQTFELTKNSNNEYILKDTIRIDGKFGLAIETYDKIDDLPFKFGVYSIELFIDEKTMYSIEFDKYNFIENPLIYTALDYNLLQQNIISHRLFNQNSSLSFIKDNIPYKANMNNGYQEFLIKISDAGNNITEVKGIIQNSTSNIDTTNNPIKTIDINGKINIKLLDSGLIIEFLEQEHTGLIPDLNLLYKEEKVNYQLYRKKPGLISSGLIKSNNIDEINIIYHTNPKKIFTKRINTLNPKQNNTFKLRNGIVIDNMNQQSFYNDIILWTNNNLEEPINYSFDIIADPIEINPTNIPFKEKLVLKYNNSENDNYGFFKYNKTKKIWDYINTTKEDKEIITNISSGGIYSVLTEKEKPIIYNITPKLNQIYKQDDIKTISFNGEDILSGINPYAIKIIVNNKEIFYDYIKYRKLITANIQKHLILGSNDIDIYIYDNLHNRTNVKGQIFIEK